MRIPTSTTSSALSVSMPAWGLLPVLGLMAAPVAAETSNAVVIDFDQSRLILGWIGLWLVAALTFAVCADKRIQLMTRLANYLSQRAQRRANTRQLANLRDMAHGDPRLLAELIAAVEYARVPAPLGAPAQLAPVASVMAVTPAPAALAPAPAAVAVAPAPAPTVVKPTSRTRPARGFRTAPLPGMPRHLQYLPG